MKAIKIRFFVCVGLLLCAFLISACSSSGSALKKEISYDAIATGDNSRDSLDWAGVYSGIIPAADCPGIKVRIVLNSDNSFELSYRYIDREDSDSAAKGKFSWDEAGSVVILGVKHFLPYYKVVENALIQLDLEGNVTTGFLAEYYVLKKEN